LVSPATSNDTNNGYYLERSQSARLTLAKAVELLPQEEEHERRQEMEVAESELVEPVTEGQGPHDEHYFPFKSRGPEGEEMLYTKSHISSARRDAVIDSFATDFRERQKPSAEDVQKLEQFYAENFPTDRHMRHMKVKSVSPIVSHPSTSQMRQEQEHSISETKERKDSGEF